MKDTEIGAISIDAETVRGTVPGLELEMSVRPSHPFGAFNILNHTNFKEPNVSLTVTTNAQGQPIFNSPGFGIITDTRAARFLQLVARYEF